MAIKAALVGALLTLVAAPALAQSVGDKYQRMREKMNDSRFSLFAEATLVLDVNQYQCGLRNQGDTCSDIFNSPTGGGGFWPTGSSNQYMFNAGINLAGIIPADAGFEWAGDTTGAYIFDARGTQQHGEGLTNIYNSLDPEDLAIWPDYGDVPDFPFVTAYVVDEDLFNPVLLGRKSASQQDSWVLYWDGNPAFSANRTHPMGVLVQQRTMAWNYPSGNEATVYIIYTFYNVTNSEKFQLPNEATHCGGENCLPDEGWRIDSIYVSADFDPDVTTDYDFNYSTGILPFNMGVAYQGRFVAPEFTYYPDLFFPPFFTSAPGLFGAKYLQSPIDPGTGEEVGLTIFTVHENPSSPGAQFDDPYGVSHLWRVLSGNVNPGMGDDPCTFPNPKERKICFLAQEPKDTRYLQSSGPFSLEPGASQTVVVAQFAAATVATDSIVIGDETANNPGVPTLRSGCAPENIRPIEVAAGWIATQPEACTETEGTIDQYKVDFVPGSLLGKALVAQTIFDNKFLLGFSPGAPIFYVVPGDNQVTVVWEPSATEVEGDPFFSAAGDPGNALYNPNYREFDVEGYRVFRGADPSRMQLVAQFDYFMGEGGVEWRGTFVDNTCETDETYVTGLSVCDPPGDVDIVHPFVQYPAGGVIFLADSSTYVQSADTALAEDVRAGIARTLGNTGVPFAYIDRGVRNGAQYFYQVKAFDINSLASGPTSLISASEMQTAFPQAPASNLADADFVASLVDVDGVALLDDLGGPVRFDPPVLDATTGTFTAPMAPTNQLSGQFLPFAPQLLPSGTYEVRIDSIIGAYYGGEVFMTLSGPGIATQSIAWDIPDVPCDAQCLYDLPPISVPSDPDVLEDLQDQGLTPPPASGQLTSAISFERTQWHSGDSDWAYQVPGFWDEDPPGEAADGGSRWFSGDNETLADPTLGYAHGELEGVDAIFQPVPYSGVLATPPVCTSDPNHMRRYYQSTWPLRRAADMKIYWGAAGVDSVIDVTHNVPVPFSTTARASYGFISDADASGAVDFVDMWYQDGFQDTPNIGCASTGNPYSALQQPVLTDVDVTGDRVADGTGFGLYIAGEPYLFQTSAIPSNTVWTLRAYNGIAGRPEGSSYEFDETPRTPGVPGLSYALTVNAPAQLVETTDKNLEEIHTVPDPYYAVSQFDLGPSTKRLKFVNLPDRCTIRIYSVGGVLVDVINHDSPGGGGQVDWDLRNRSNQFVASGVYFFHVVTEEGKEHVGKFTVINFAN